MAKYVVIYEDERKDALAPDLLKGHVEHLRDLHSQGILFLYGPLKNSDGKGLLKFSGGSGKLRIERPLYRSKMVCQLSYLRMD